MTNSYIKNHTNSFIIHGKEYEVTAPARFNQQTHELMPDLELDDQALALADAMYRAEFGIVSITKIKAYRERLGLTQRELAQLLGWSPNTIALYETGAIPTKANNRFLKALISDDNMLLTIVNQNKAFLSNALVHKLNQYFHLNDDEILDEITPAEYTALTLTNWFRVENYYHAQIDKNIEELTQMKVMKLLYFAFGRYLSRYNQFLFESDILALQYGPVVAEVRDVYNGQKSIVAEGIDEQAFADFNAIEENDIMSEFLHQILHDYDDKNAYGLSQITHQPESPWSITSDGGQTFGAVISPLLIAEKFTQGHEM